MLNKQPTHRGGASAPFIANMIKPPYTAQMGISGVWISDGNGVTVCDMNPLLDPDAAFQVANLLATGANERLRQLHHLTEISKKGGRPRSKKPSKAALAKRRERTRQSE